ncbi:hypothetical protein N8H74_11750 [Pseudomonas sp. B2M1-30]|uniref:hypothetical protein n=1 Tax=Pseudomonas TaxID=286 RepID=UPI0021C60CDE|nr:MULTISPECIES: hypothetical protein [Pseudomonas]MCU0118930.1 hypothetical protein [Pseudomonas sp. B2M1-30]MCU7263412.1 hypothetical protein [Pseudomonas koreensis]
MKREGDFSRSEGLQGFDRDWLCGIFFQLFFCRATIVQEVIKKTLFSLHVVFRNPFLPLQTQLSPTEAGLESTLSEALK